MKIHFLGTNGWFTDEKGNTPCILIDSKDHYVIFDAGNALYKIDQYITDTNKPISLFISHFHLDHVNGLHVLAKFNFPQGIDVFVGNGRKEDFENLVRPPYTIGYQKNEKNIKQLATPIRLHELTPDGQLDLVPMKIETQELFHAYKDHGYRIELEGKIIAYSGDTGFGGGNVTLAQNADLLIHECSLLNPVDNDIWGHVDPYQAATIASKAQVKKLILTHFDPVQYKTLNDRKIAESKARETFPETIAAKDGDMFNL